MLSSTVKSISISYDPINDQNTFSNGDTISGRVILELTKDAEINSLSVKAKGKADVHWREKHGDRHVSYNAKEDYFKLQQFIYRKVKDDGDQNERLVDQVGETYGKSIPAGKHVYQFSFQIPDGKMPSSYKGIHGKVLYTVEAKLDRSMRMDQKDKAEFTFISTSDMKNPVYLVPQYGMETKKMKLFTKGSASMKISIDKKGYLPGEAVTITADIENDSSRDLVPKFSLEREESFFARGHQKQFNKRVLKEEGEAIPSQSHKTINYVVKIPPDVKISITHCRIIKVQYHLKVYLDVPYASDPEVVFPVIVFPPIKVLSPMSQPGPSADFGNTNQEGWNSYPPPYGAGGFAPPSDPGTVPGGYPPPAYPGGFAPPDGPGGDPPPAYPGELPPPSGPGGNPPPSYPGGFPPPTFPGAYSAPNAQGGFPPQSAPGPYLPQTVPGAPPPQMAPVNFLSQSDPSAPPTLTGPIDFLSSTVPSAPPPESTTGMYPSLSNFGGKA